MLVLTLIHYTKTMEDQKMKTGKKKKMYINEIINKYMISLSGKESRSGMVSNMIRALATLRCGQYSNPPRRQFNHGTTVFHCQTSLTAEPVSYVHIANIG